MYRVLIIETNVLMSQAIQKMINKNGEFSIAASVKDEESAFQLCRTEKIDLIFLSATLMGYSTVTVAEKLKKITPASKIYIISVDKKDPFMADFLKLKVEEYLITPLTFSKVGEILSAYKQKQRNISQEFAVKALFNVLERKEYAKIYEAASAVTEQIIAEKDGYHREKMLEIAREIQDRIEVICNKKVDLKTKFPIKGGFSDDKSYWKFWLVDITDFAFQVEAVSKCEALEKVFRMINENMAEPLKLEQISLNCNISEGYLNKKIRELLGVSTMDYVQRRKLSEAKKKIAFSSLKFSDIAYELGYNESSYFSKVFKKYEGITPIQFKRSVRT